MRVPVATFMPQHVYRLRLEAGGTVTVGSNSIFDLQDRGYPAGAGGSTWSGPDFSVNTRTGCHGGLSADAAVDCTYGRYEQAQFAGSGGVYGAGGGALELFAPALVLDGHVWADAGNGYSYASGAGGGVHLEVGVLSGAGGIDANGGYGGIGGSGGRISVYAGDRAAFTGTLAAHTNPGDPGFPQGYGGAGTVYLKDSAAAYGHMVIDNAGHSSPTDGTPIRRVGRHAIASAEQIAPGVWQIGVAGSPWLPSDTTLGWGVDGIEVDLDAAGAPGTLYRVVSNTANTITVFTDDDLSSIAGQELIGVHTFQTLTVTAGASVTFGTDRVIVQDAAGSQIDAGALNAGEIILQ
jgi:hypothetical protein